MERLIQDLRVAGRMFAKHRLVTSAAVLSLALAVAGNTTVFSLVSALVLQQSPFVEPERLVRLFQTYPTNEDTFVSTGNFVDWRARSQSFEGLSAIRAARFNLTSGDQPEPVFALEATANIFRLLSGAEAALGRTFLPEEERVGHHQVAVVSHPFWQNRRAADPSLVGDTLELDGTSYRVVGVMPADYEFAGFTPEVFVPLVTTGELQREVRTLTVWARLKSGVSPKEGQAELEVIAETLEREYPEANEGYGARLRTVSEVDNRAGALLYLLQGALLFVLLIACANLANLLLLRGQDRQHEIAIRLALGAPQQRIIRQLLTEGLALALCGGAVGCVLAVWGVQFLGVFTVVPGQDPPQVHSLVLGFSLAISVFAGVICGLAPAVQASKPNVTGELREGSRGVTMGSRRHLLARGAVVAEVALALAMLSGAGLLIGSFRALQEVDLGLERDHLLTAQVNSPESRSIDDDARAALPQRMQDRVEAVPGVTAAAVTSRLPAGLSTPRVLFTIDGRQGPDDDYRLTTTVMSVSPGYLPTLGVPLMQGRSFSVADSMDAPRVVLINDALRRLHWPADSPLGARMTIRGESREIVGVTGNVRQDLQAPPTVLESIVYLPQAHVPDPRWLFVVARTGPDPGTLREAVQAAVREVDPNATVFTQTMDEALTRFFGFVSPRLESGLLVGFGLLAVFLAAIGMYGVIAFSVSRRTQEIGVRMAMGAHRGHVLVLVMREGLALVAIGFALGLPGVFLVSRAVSSTVFGLTPVSLGTTVLVGVGLFVVAVLASYLPARRAADLDPMRALQ